MTIPNNKRPAPQPAADDDTPQQEPKRQHVISADDNLRIKIPRFPSVPPSVSNAAPPRMIIRPGSQQNPLEIRDDDEGVVKELKMMTAAAVPRGGIQQQQQPYKPTLEELTPQNRNTMAAALHYLSLGEQMSKNVLFPANQSQRAELFRTELSHAIKTFEELCVPGAAAIVAARRAP